MTIYLAQIPAVGAVQAFDRVIPALNARDVLMTVRADKWIVESIQTMPWDLPMHWPHLHRISFSCKGRR